MRSNLATSVEPASEHTGQGRRQHYRQKVRSLAYISWDSHNRGVLRDLSESGAAVQVLQPLQLNQRLSFRLDLSSPRSRIEGEARVAWADVRGQAGIEFVDVPARSHRALKEWLLTQVLADAHRTVGDATEGLLFSFTPRPAIRLEPAKSTRTLQILWFRVPVDRFARFVDCLALLCAVLLFSVMALTMTDDFPAWPITVGLVLGVTAMFAGLYWFLFSKWFGITPGQRLSQLAARERPGATSRAELRARFR
jgi:hypothetical protein